MDEDHRLLNRVAEAAQSSLYPSVKNTINYIKVAALYGHTTVGSSFPSISLSPVGSISISFSGNPSIEKIGGHKVKIGTGSTIVDI